MADQDNTGAGQSRGPQYGGKMIYYVDIPHPDATEDNELGWINVGKFLTRETAELYLYRRWGIRADQTQAFITEG